MSLTVIQVVPLRRFPRTKGVFDYELPTGMTVGAGDLVQVPFKNSLCPALVIEVISGSSKIDQRLKKVYKIIASGFVSRPQLALISWLANYSGVSLATVAKLTVPFLPTNKIIFPTLIKQPTRSANPRLPVNIIPAEVDQKIKIVGTLIVQVIKRQQQVLFLVPEKHMIEPWQKVWAKDYAVVTYTGSDKITALRAAWLKTRTSKAQIIIGTKAALWLNFYSLGGVVVDQAESESYNQVEQNPRFDAVKAAGRLAANWQAPLAKLSSAPRLEHWQSAQAGQEQWRELPTVRQRKIKIIDLKASPRRAKSGLLTDSLADEIERTLNDKKKVLLYLNRRGGAGASICTDCGYRPLCQHCERPLVHDNETSILTCFHCDFKQGLSVPCPKCGGTSLAYSSGGISKLNQEVTRLWPNKKISVVEDKFKTELSDSARQADIILGSRTAVRAAENLTLGLSAIVRAETELSWPDFRSVERMWQLTRRLSLISAQVSVQTYGPEHYLWTALASAQTKVFYQAELATREKFIYPPVVNLLRFTIEVKDKDEAFKKCQDLKNLLINNIPPSVQLIGPYQDYFRQRGKKWRWHVLLKHKNDFDPAGLWPILPPDIIIDRDPWLVLS